MINLIWSDFKSTTPCCAIRGNTRSRPSRILNTVQNVEVDDYRIKVKGQLTLLKQTLPIHFIYCWFSHDVTKIQTTKLSILLRFYFHGVLGQLKTNFQTNFRFKRVLGFVIEYAWISKLLRDEAFTWRPRELSFRLKKRLFSRNIAIQTVQVLEKVLL